MLLVVMMLVWSSVKHLILIEEGKIVDLCWKRVTHHLFFKYVDINLAATEEEFNIFLRFQHNCIVNRAIEYFLFSKALLMTLTSLRVCFIVQC